jgi:hypothetical protein
VRALIRIGVLAAVVASGGTAFALRDAHAGSSAGATIDRTLACTVLPPGTGVIEVEAHPKIGGGPYASPPQLTLYTGNPTSSYAGYPVLATLFAGGAPRVPPALTLSTKLCRQAKATVPLTPDGLNRSLAPAGAKATCLTARQVFVHVHVVMSSKPRWTTKTDSQVARGNAVSAQIAVRSRKQKPPVFMALTGTKTSFFSADSCF